MRRSPIELAAVVIAGLALTLSVLDFVARRADRRRIVALEEARRADELRRQQVADVVARIERNGRHAGEGSLADPVYPLAVVVENRGPAKAKGVQVIFSPRSGDPLMAVSGRDLVAGQTYRKVLREQRPGEPPFELDVRWNDPRGLQQATLNVSISG